jgi:hypothetical protein
LLVLSQTLVGGYIGDRKARERELLTCDLAASSKHKTAVVRLDVGEDGRGTPDVPRNEDRTASDSTNRAWHSFSITS